MQSGKWYKRSLWNDFRFPAQGINPVGSAKPPTIDTDDGFLLFDAAAENIVCAGMQLDHGMDFAEIRPHVHWCKTSTGAGNVLLKLEYKAFKMFEVAGAWVTLAEVSAPMVAEPNLAEFHNMMLFGSMDIAGFELSDMIAFRLSRMGADVLDTYADDMKLLEFDVHYQRGRSGSIDEFAN